MLIIIAPFISRATHNEPGIDSLQEFGKNKEIPEQYRKPILTALSHFPELKDVHVIFRIRKEYAPLTTKPNFAGVFKRKNHRTYIITISNETIDTLKGLLIQNLAFEEQVGVTGHELSHVVDFNSKNFPQTIAIGIGHLSKKYIDKMEFNTDRICIMHGLGEYLLAYSMHVRQTMHVHNWRGVDYVNKGNGNGHYERYMNPDTIEKYMSAVPSHQ
ncbi:MAG: hypothetical protein EPN92_06775 [Chitinophagaceae bacterium]|nr:MAG: hypothetical protein EPN92_06775 [Chitinophagaceae bacterium]